jgi:hypothetical protein
VLALIDKRDIAAEGPWRRSLYIAEIVGERAKTAASLAQAT